MLIKYTRTNIFKHTNFKEPIIRPLFFDFPADNITYDQVDKQFMYGSAIKVSIQYENEHDEKPTYFPSGLWCSVAYNVN
jgi:alpha-glucosidase (family GH31 glycosyl hydrolase)